MDQKKPYLYVSFSWASIDLDKAISELKKEFKTELIGGKSYSEHPAILKPYRYKWRVIADNLRAFLSKRRGLLFQKKFKPFTTKDLKLREKFLDLYPHNRGSPFPVNYTWEPKFEVEK